MKVGFKPSADIKIMKIITYDFRKSAVKKLEIKIVKGIFCPYCTLEKKYMLKM